MFSIAAINDTETKGQWEPLAPTKEAQEFHLTQTYHDGLLKLQGKEYEKARELLESVMKDPLMSNVEVDGNASDGHLLQLKFLALKNLATVFLQQGSSHHESALRCYLQAVEIDTKDSVVWNQLGTLSCSMGLLSISRWAFEQGLLCSPNNWNCMEKLLEVLIAIGDEVACLSVAELILRHWPSHSRALHVKRVIEETESVPFAPRGIDKLEPKHVRLKFHDKRKASDQSPDVGPPSKKRNQNIELHLPEVSWVALTDVLMEILRPLNGCGSEIGAGEACRSGDVRLTILLPSSSDNVGGSVENKVPNLASGGEAMPSGDCPNDSSNNIKEKQPNFSEEQPQERRSTRLESLRSRKPDKEELDFGSTKDLAKVVPQLLDSFVISRSEDRDSSSSASCSVSCTNQADSSDSECKDVTDFVRETSENFGAYHLGHLLLEHAAKISLAHSDASLKFLELEKLTRHWGKDRTPECSLFLAELYFDLGYSPPNSINMTEFLSEASYHLCKVIESVALDYPFNLMSSLGKESLSPVKSLPGTPGLSSSDSTCQNSLLDSLPVSNKGSFWVRYFWLSGQLSVSDGNKAKAHEEFCISLSLLEKTKETDDSLLLVRLPHCEIIKDLTVDRILHEINLLKVDFLLEKTLGEMIAKEMYTECVSLLAPLLFPTGDALPLSAADKKDKGITSVELAALDILIKACENAKPMDIESWLNSHRRKLQVLLVLAGLDERLVLSDSLHQKSLSEMLSASSIVLQEDSSKHWNFLVSEEVKSISKCLSQVKNFIDQSGGSIGMIPANIISDTQSLLLAVMYNIAKNMLNNKSSGLATGDQPEEQQSSCFIDAAISFCKLQHLDPSIPVKTQVELIVAAHDLLAEYGLCCEGGNEEEGAFLKFAIKHLLALDMKLKSVFNSSDGCDEQLNHDSDINTSVKEITSNKLDVEMSEAENVETTIVEKDESDGTASANVPSSDLDKRDDAVHENTEITCTDDGKLDIAEKGGDHPLNSVNELTEDEKEELEEMIDNALDQCFFCRYGLNLRSDSSYEDDLAVHKNASRGDYQTKEQCADVFQYILPSAKASSKTGLVKLRRVLRTIRKHFPHPPEDILAGNIIDKYLDDLNISEDQLSEMAGSEGYLETLSKMLLCNGGSLKQYKASSFKSSEPYLEVYSNLYYYLAQSEEMSATDKWPGFVLTKEGEEFVQQNAKLFKYDLLYNPLRFESWQRLANIYDEEVDLLLNDGSKHINVVGWRKNETLSRRVETSRRRSRRCFLMSLALAKTSDQQGEIHELLALVYYDSLQNVVPIYDQRTVLPSKDAAFMMFCENSLKHFKKAFSHKQDWSHAFNIGKLCEKLGSSPEISFSYYDKAITLNPSAVDPFYRMHASRLKLLWTRGRNNIEVLKVISTYCYDESVKDTVMELIGKMTAENPLLPEDGKDNSCQNIEKNNDESEGIKVWNNLYSDCVSALEICIGGDLKHFHKARFTLAQGLYKRGETGDLQRAKDELSFCFKSSRSCFTINMWEIDGMVKKGRRRTPGVAANKKALEVNLPESSRKFITCIRKYLLFYLKLLEETRDVSILDRAYISLRQDKRFSLCIEDLVPVAIGRYIKSLVVSMNQAENVSSNASSSSENLLDKIFALFMEQGNLWPEICSLPEIKSSEISESSLYGCLHHYIVSLEKSGKLETLEAINEKIRKRFKNPKLSSGNCAKVCRHASMAWCRSLIISLAMITPLQSGLPCDIDGVHEYSQVLCIDLQTHEIWNSSFEDSNHLESLQSKWSPILTRIKNVIIKKASSENLETANSVLKSCYNFYRESSSVLLPSGVNLSLVPSHPATEIQTQARTEGIEILEISTPRKLLLWAYTLVHGRYANISVVVKYCEDSAKLKMKKGASTSSAPQNASIPNAVTLNNTVAAGGGGKEGGGHGGGSEADAVPVTSAVSTSLPESENRNSSSIPLPSSTESQRSLFTAPQLHPCNKSVAEKSADQTEDTSTGHNLG